MGSFGTQTNLQMAILYIYMFLDKYGTHTSLCSEVAISQWVEWVAEVGAEIVGRPTLRAKLLKRAPLMCSF